MGKLGGGGLKETNYERLKQNLIETDGLEYNEWFLNTRRWGVTKTMGFNMGIETLLYYAMGETDIKNVIPFPRYRKTCPN